jgi:hypothetical protein
MREFTFDIVYEPGAGVLMDVFAEFPGLSATTVDGCIRADRFWRIERVVGPPGALDRIEALYRDGRIYESVTETPWDGHHDYAVLGADGDERVFYSYVENCTDGESVHTLVGRLLPPGLVFETIRRDDCQSWRILTRSDRNVGLLYDNLSGRLREGLSFRMGHLRDAEGWRRTPLDDVRLPREQRLAVEAAVEAGYYETPRVVSLGELADDLDVPRSTLSYRLRRAEAQLARTFLDRS